MLATLVTAINNGGHPIIQDGPRLYQGALEKGLPTRNRMHNAVSILLSLDAEVVAVTVNDPSTQQGFYQLPTGPT